ncbi:serpin B4-like isoform X1 [Hippopotamus amphibius kiboko]|uniref:serpin B4-like isoform X1 n=1 Tax=Hippopotamus amphibius kiboko TaxID=575201 RepID=UPI002598A824|nr:serpin B4-like isoform X1 [Hippopotamus amphibius kiboko]
MSSLSEANIHFAIDLFQQIRQSKKENIFYSPFSMTSALAMTSLGAQGQTASEIEKVLHFNEITENTNGGGSRDPVEKLENVHHQFQNLLTEIKKPSDAYELKVANRLYGEKSIVFLQEYIDNVKKFYLASVESADFVHAAEESRNMINSWVESQTNEKVKDLFPKDSFSTDTILVLVNAMYFKGQWLQEFKKENTVEEKFWLNKDMHVRILEIPYKGKELSMVVLLPDEVDGLQKVEDQLTAEKLIEWTSPQNMREGLVDLHLPRFRVEESYDLNDPLKALGMVAAFSDRDADFSGMTEIRGLVVSKVVHKSVVEVNEEGTEATGATGIEIITRSGRIPDTFHCDHPFLFFIKHNKTNTILFYGRVSSPEM